MKRVKLLPSIIMLVLCVGILAVGIYAVNPIASNINGIINISAGSGVKVDVYSVVGSTDTLIDTAFGSSSLDLKVGGSALNASSAPFPEDVPPAVFKIVLSTNKENINYVVDTETIELFDGATVGGTRVENALIVTKKHEPFVEDDAITTDTSGRACFALNKPYTITISVRCGKLSSERIIASFDLKMKIYESTDTAAPTQINGVDYLNFGEYPQSLAASATGEGVIPTGYSPNNDTFGAYDDAGGEIPRAVYTKDGDTSGTRYVLLTTTSGSTTTNGLYTIEPLKWRILGDGAVGRYTDADGNSAGTLLMCDTIVENVVFYDGVYNRTDANNNPIYRTNYNESYLRKFLINTFYNNSFNLSEGSIISSKTGQVKNDTGTHDSSSTASACADTSDKVFALSCADVKNTAYGFENTTNKTITRAIFPSAYAVATGVNAYGSEGQAEWLLRSPSNDTYDLISFVYCDGELEFEEGWTWGGAGCVPAILVNL